LIEVPCFALLDEPGAGKTKQVVDAACFLADVDEIDTVLVVSPASVRAVWAGEFGEIDKHAWFPSTISEYHSRTPRIHHAPGVLNWHVTNYEFIRDPDRLKALMAQLVGRKLWIVLDESIRIKGNRTASAKACLKLAPLAQRRTILNGTPFGNNPLDLWAQFEFLSPRIIGCQNFYQFRGRYALMGGYYNKQVIGWQNLDELQGKIAPYALRRLKADCLDLPEKTFTIREAALSGKTWDLYKSMRDDCVAWLDAQTASVAPQAVVRLLRLSQVTAGFIGGLDGGEADLLTEGLTKPTREVGREKLDAFLEYLDDLLVEDPALRLLVWCRFRAELDRAAKAVAERFPNTWVGRIEGGQRETDRRARIDTFQTDHDRQTEPRILFGNPQAGGLGLTLTAAHRVVYLSNDYNLINRLQSEDRVHRPGQRHPVLYTDVIATGPEGQRTIDHVILTALRKKQDLLSWTTDIWRRELTA
jgi:SNF2 family DNA or RNA helicase